MLHRSLSIVDDVSTFLAEILNKTPPGFPLPAVSRLTESILQKFGHWALVVLDVSS